VDVYGWVVCAQSWQLRDQLYAHEWVVYAKAPFAGPAQVLDYVGRYPYSDVYI
jgi:hypothetical protein